MKRILVVDDSATSRLLFKAHMPKGGDYQVGEAKDLAGALETARNLEPDLVFLDYNMPERNGVEIAAEMRAAGIDAEFFLLTANTQESVLQEAQAAGINRILEKPITAAKLERALKDSD